MENQSSAASLSPAFSSKIQLIQIYRMSIAFTACSPFLKGLQLITLVVRPSRRHFKITVIARGDRVQRGSLDLCVVQLAYGDHEPVGKDSGDREGEPRCNLVECELFKTQTHE